MWHRPVNSLFLYISDDIKSTGNIASFDLDWTLGRTFKSGWPKDPTDVILMPRRLERLQQLSDEGWTIVIFTNQKSTTEHKKKNNFLRVNNFIQLLLGKIKIILLMSTDEDEYRKPNIGMYTMLEKVVPKITTSFYCGDAAGRPQDFADSDIMFAKNTGMKFYTPEEMFPYPSIDYNNIDDVGDNDGETPTMIVFVGMPGVGKTTYYKNNLEPLGYVQINQDLLKTKAKCLRITRDTCIGGKNVAIDCTNPGQSRREEFYAIAKKYGYKIIVIHFTGDGRGWNKLRPKPVPPVGYGMYYKYLVEPTTTNTPGCLISY